MLTATPLNVDGVSSVCLIVTDLTEHEARMAAESAGRAKDQFLAALSHELRTPLTPALMTLSTLEADPSLPPAMRDDLALVRRNVELETKLIDDLLDLSRIRSGKLNLRAELVSVHQVIQQVTRMYHGELTEKSLSLQCELAAGNDQVQGDAARLHQVVWNLLKNAIKFSREGGTLAIRTRNPFVAAAGAIQVQVCDHGQGISPEMMPRIFNAFEQAGANGQREKAGLGLGLAIARAIVELHKGHIEAHSDGPGHGATFTVTFPLATPIDGETPSDGAPGAAAAAASASLQVAPSASSPTSLRILLVEDHAETAHVLGRLLRSFGHEVKAVDSVAMALQAAATATFDVMLSDIGLPDATGYDLMRQIRDHHRIPGIALTGYGMEDDLRRSRDAGFVDHVVKPVTLAQLQAALARAVVNCYTEDASPLTEASTKKMPAAR
jgi:CheY-like chemotaxis protein/nitrogen-specific signal transduction histidine kinase